MVTILFYVLFFLLIVQRIGEIMLAKKNTRWIFSQGGYEVGSNHYKYIVMIHIGFLSSLLTEVSLGNTVPPSWWSIPFFCFLVAQILRYWCIRTLGSHWNTRICILPDSKRISTGPYRWLKHPNYFVVLVEFATIPAIFGAYYTAVLWTLVNYAFLRLIRIPVEEGALEEMEE